MDSKEGQTFWEHLDELRSVLIKIIGAVMLLWVVAFVLKDRLFAVVLAPSAPDFVTYRFLAGLGGMFSKSDFSAVPVDLINTGLAGQFMIHMKMALCAAVIAGSPYILYQLFRFVSPALYADERRYAFRVVGGAYVMFMLGALLGYYLVFPLTFRFLGAYQVSLTVSNMIELDSYISTLLVMCLSMGIVFEIPVLCWMFARLGFIDSAFLRRYRRHAIVIIMTMAAIITPTSDIFTLLAVSLPMWLLYEFSILLVRITEPDDSGAVRRRGFV